MRVGKVGVVRRGHGRDVDEGLGDQPRLVGQDLGRQRDGRARVVDLERHVDAVRQRRDRDRPADGHPADADGRADADAAGLLEDDGGLIASGAAEYAAARGPHEHAEGGEGAPEEETDGAGGLQGGADRGEIGGGVPGGGGGGGGAG